MANQHGSVWTRTPGLHDLAVDLIGEGLLGRALSGELAKRGGVHVSADAIHKHLDKCSGKQCSEGPREPLDVLTEPLGGYAVNAAAPAKHEHPKGWEPHVEETGNTATAVSQPMETANPDEEELIRGWNLDPKLWRIVGPVNCRRWQSVVAIRDDKGKTIDTKTVWLHYFKANLERIDPVRESQLASLIEEIRTHIPIPFAPPKGDDATVIAIADPQIGKGDQGGTPRAAANWLRSISAFEERVPSLRAQGKSHGALYVLGMGDLIENCDGFYPQQAYRTDRNLTDQITIVRRLILKSLERWAPLFERVVVACVGGNHGENRKDGKSFTDFADNHDVGVFTQVEDVLDANRAAYGHVSFSIPKDSLSQTLDMGGEIAGMTHGQVFGKGAAGQPAKRAIDWWMKQAHGGQPIGEARIMFTAHYHHLLVTEAGWKTHFQCPSLEPGSDWYTNQTGLAARPGMLTVRIGRNVSESGWADLEVL